MRMYEGFYLSAILIGLSLLATFVGIIPGMKTTYALFGETQILREDVRKYKAKLSLLDSIDEDSLLGQLAVTTAVLPIEKAVPSLFATAEGVGASSGINVLDLTLTSPGSLSSESGKTKGGSDKAYGANVLPFVTHTKGSFDQIRSYFVVAQSARRILRIASFNVSFLTDGSTNMQTNFEGFFAPLPKTLGSAGSEIAPLTGDDLEFISTLSNREDTASTILGEVGNPQSDTGKTDPFSL